MASNDERTPKFVHIDERNESSANESISFGFEQELKSLTVRNGDSARFEAKIRLSAKLDRSLLTVEWRLNDQRITLETNERYRFDSFADENLYRMDIRHCEQEDEGVYTIYISYDQNKYSEESSAYLFVDSE